MKTTDSNEDYRQTAY